MVEVPGTDVVLVVDEVVVVVVVSATVVVVVPAFSPAPQAANVMAGSVDPIQRVVDFT